MEITSLGENGFRIKGKDATVVINPAKVTDMVGTAVALFSKKSSLTPSDPAPFIVENSGEYEIKGVRIYGFVGKNKQEVLYLIHQDDLYLAHLGTQTEALTKKLVEEFNIVNILFVSAAGDPTDLISQLEPNICVPMNLTPESTARLQKEMGEAAIEKTPKLKVTSFSDEDEETKVVILS